MSTAQGVTSIRAGVLGRNSELANMRNWLSLVLSGERQFVFVTGEAGIGKTTLVQALLEEAAGVPGIRIVRGQCLEHYGAGEAYLPVLDGLSRLAPTDSGQDVVAAIRQHAPAWLVQMPSLISPAERESLQGYVTSATREGML